MTRPGRSAHGCDCDMAKTGGVQRITQGGGQLFIARAKQK